MATELVPTKKFALTQFAGEEGRSVQVTNTTPVMMPHGLTFQHVTMTKDEAFELALALLEWTKGQRDPE